MLAIGRSLLTNPVLLLLDEPTEGLAPFVVKDFVEAIRTINAEGVGTLLDEQNFKIPLKLAHRQYVLDGERAVWTGTIQDFLTSRAEVERLNSVRNLRR
jgi:branched-chain amino acid transport system ATP-binding protein